MDMKKAPIWQGTPGRSLDQLYVWDVPDPRSPRPRPVWGLGPSSGSIRSVAGSHQLRGKVGDLPLGLSQLGGEGLDRGEGGLVAGGQLSWSCIVAINSFEVISEQNARRPAG